MVRKGKCIASGPSVMMYTPIAASKAGDAKFRLEKYLADIVSYLQPRIFPYLNPSFRSNSTFNSSKFLTALSLSGKQQQSITRPAIWLGLPIPTLSCTYARSKIPRPAPSPFFRKNGEFDETRKVFSDVHAKNLDWPEAIWEAWISFEHLHGTVDQVDACLDKIEKAQYQVNIRRAKVSGLCRDVSIPLTRMLNILKEVEKASYQAMQMQAANVPVAQVPVPIISGDATMTVATAPRERGTKRGADDTQDGDGHKRARIGEFLCGVASLTDR